MLSTVWSSQTLRNGMTAKVLFAGVLASVIAIFSTPVSSAYAAADGLDRQDRDFLIAAAETGNAQINASKMALKKSSDPAIKNFAEKLIAEHTKTTGELKKLADSKNITVPDAPNAMQRASIDMLDKLNGSSFDRQYADLVGISAQKNAVALFKKEESITQDADLRVFAASGLPVLRMYLIIAQDLKLDLDATR